MCRDMWGYISLGYFKQSRQEEQVGSSTMPHKVNPIDFENAEGNLSFAVAQSHYCAGNLPLSRWQRDLSDSTLLRNLGTIFGYSLLGYEKCWQGLMNISIDRHNVATDLDNRWELLTEAVRRSCGRGDKRKPIKN